MFILASNDIRAFPFQEAAHLGPIALEEWAATTVRLNGYNSWMLPQLHAYFSKLKATKLPNGLYDPKSLWVDNLGSDEWTLGVWRVATQLSRSKLVKSQNVKEYARYSALVPLILSALKDGQGIKYSSWSREGLAHIMGAQLFEAATAIPPTVHKARAIELRTIGLTVKSGKTAGTVQKATSCWTLTGMQNTEWHEMPKHTLTMLAQIWVADPSLRHSNMILDPTDWDHMPEPLLDTEVLTSSTKYAKPSKLDVAEMPTW